MIEIKITDTQLYNGNYMKYFKSLIICIISALLISCGDSDTHHQYKIGRTLIDWTDQKRIERFSSQGSEHRKLAALVWYPAHPAPTMTPGPWLDPTLVPLVAQASGLSEDALTKVPTNSFIDAEIDKKHGPFPILIMSHGDGGNPLIYSYTAEHLASQGYIVVGIFHTYNADMSIFSDGSIVLGQSNATVSNLIGDFSRGFDDQFRQGSQLSSYFAEDAVSALNQLERINSEDPKFKDTFDLTRVGMFGHSFGGSHAFNAINIDHRIQAISDLDGTIFSLNFDKGSIRPFMVISESIDSTEEQLRQELAKQGLSSEQIDLIVQETLSPLTAFNASSRGYFVTTKKFLHNNFTDFGLLANLGFPQDQISTDIDPKKALDISNTFLTEFFDQELKGMHSYLLDTEVPFSDTEVQKRDFK